MTTNDMVAEYIRSGDHLFHIWTGVIREACEFNNDVKISSMWVKIRVGHFPIYDDAGEYSGFQYIPIFSDEVD